MGVLRAAAVRGGRVSLLGGRSVRAPRTGLILAITRPGVRARRGMGVGGEMGGRARSGLVIPRVATPDHPARRLSPLVTSRLECVEGAHDSGNFLQSASQGHAARRAARGFAGVAAYLGQP